MEDVHMEDDDYGVDVITSTSTSTTVKGSQISVAIDAPNVCWSYLKSRPGYGESDFPKRLRPPLTGLQLCIDFWRKFGVEPVAVCPEWWNHVKAQKIWNEEFEKADSELFLKLRDNGILYCAPSGGEYRCFSIASLL
mmetsp:Transcript_16103/g.20630  ORF Transcript_16103/g.20630 Transcript_16103/m.20630 type:complete len:137 (+) Transcript_16103:76-486(+)